jgi:hypothetical protein
VLSSDGRAKLTVIQHDQSSPQIVDYEIPKEEISRIARVVDRTGLLCQTDHVRDGYFVYDLGRFSFDLVSGKYSKSVYVDGCDTVADLAALFETREALLALQLSLRNSLAWGPYGTASVPAPQGCPERQRAAK